MKMKGKRNGEVEEKNIKTKGFDGLDWRYEGRKARKQVHRIPIGVNEQITSDLYIMM